MEVIIESVRSDKIKTLSKKILQLHADIFNNGIVNINLEKLSMSDENSICIILSLYGRPLAMCMLKWIENFKMWYLFNFGVHPHRRKEGLGTGLWSEIHNFYLKHQRPIMWEVETQNIIAIQFYNKMGATIIGEKDNCLIMRY